MNRFHLGPRDVYNPIYAVALLVLLSLLAWGLSYALGFFRRELAAEDETRLTPLDGLRGVLCFAVMYCHSAIMFDYVDSGTWKHPPSNFYSLLGDGAVALFFCITAFLFWTRITASGGRLTPWPFPRGRLYRLGPLYLFSLVVVLGIVVREINWHALSTYKEVFKITLLGSVPWRSIGEVEINRVDAGVTWSLQYEWGFYLLLPALAMFVSGGQIRRLWYLLAGLTVMLDVGLFYFSSPGWWPFMRWSVRRLRTGAGAGSPRGLSCCPSWRCRWLPAMSPDRRDGWRSRWCSYR